MADYYLIFFLAIFFLSTPAAVIAAFIYNIDRMGCAIANSYGFSIAMIAIYVYPFLISSPHGMTHRVHQATMNWIIWLSVFTEIVFQIPHNVLVKQLNEFKGTSFEWPFYSYGLSDSRWSEYHDGAGLAPEVWLINWNDAGLGLIVLAALIGYYLRNKDKTSTILLALVTLFRDATLWRETVEYMWDHHRRDYPHSTSDPAYRNHAIALLWLVNGIWLIAPVVTVWWAYNQINDLVVKKLPIKEM